MAGKARRYCCQNVFEAAGSRWIGQPSFFAALQKNCPLTPRLDRNCWAYRKLIISFYGRSGHLSTLDDLGNLCRRILQIHGRNEV